MSQTWDEGLFGCFGDCKLCELNKWLATNSVFSYEYIFNGEWSMKYSMRIWKGNHKHLNLISFPLGLLQYFCPCLVLGYVSDSLGENKKKACVAYFVPLLNLYYIYKLRNTVKLRKDIDESKVAGFLFTVFCTFCTLNQLARETDSGPYGSSMARE